MTIEDRSATDIDLNQKIRKNSNNLAGSRVSVRYYKIKGDITKNDVKDFITQHYLKAKDEQTEGFQRNPKIGKNSITTLYAKEGVRTVRIATDSGRIKKCSLEQVSQFTELNFDIKEDFIKVTIMGGNQKFLDNTISKILRILANRHDCKLFPSEIDQEKIRKLLWLHNEEVSLIKTDPSTSEEYAEEFKEEGKKTGKRYKYVVNEGVFKGEKILESKAISRMLKDNEDIDILKYKSKLDTETDEGETSLTYELESSGKITFFLNKTARKFYEDELRAAEALIEELEYETGQKLLTESLSAQENKDTSLISYSIDKTKTLEAMAAHLKSGEINALKPLLKKLKEVTLTPKEKAMTTEIFVEALSNRPAEAIELTELMSDIIDDSIYKSESYENLKQECLVQDIEDLDSIMRQSHGTLNEVIEKDIVQNKAHLKDLWSEVQSVEDSNRKGRILEEFFAVLLHLEEGLRESNIRRETESEEIDIVVRNKVDDPYWLNLGTQKIFIECKNWSGKVGKDAFGSFCNDIHNHPAHTQVGICVSVNGFTKKVSIEQGRKDAQGKLIATITGNDIKKFLESDFSLKEWLENILDRSMS